MSTGLDALLSDLEDVGSLLDTLIKQQDENETGHLTTPMKNQINTFQVKLRILSSSLRYMYYRCNDPEIMEPVIYWLGVDARRIKERVGSFSREKIDESSLQVAIRRFVSTMELDYFHNEVRQVYEIILDAVSLSSEFLMAHGIILSFLDSMQENLRDLLNCNASSTVCPKNELETLLLELRFVGTFLRYSAKTCVMLEKWKDLLVNIEVVVNRVGCGSYYLCWTGAYYASRQSEVFVNLIPQIKEMKMKLKDIYVEILNVSGSANMTDEYVVNYIDSLLKNLKEILNYKADLTVGMKDQIDNLIEELRLMRTFPALTLEQCSKLEKWNDLIKYIGTAAKEAECVIYLFYVNVSDQKMASEPVLVLSNFLEKIKPFRAEAREFCLEALQSAQPKTPRTLEDVLAFVNFLQENLKKLWSCANNLPVPQINQAETLQHDLRFLRSCLVDTPVQYTECDEWDDLLLHIEALANEAEPFIILLLYADVADQKMVCESDLAFAAFLEKKKLFMAQVKKFYLRILNSPQAITPKTDKTVSGFIDILLENLSMLMIYKADLIIPVKDQIETLHEELRFLKLFLKDTLEHCPEHEKAKDLLLEIEDVANGAWCVICLLYANETDQYLDGETFSALSDLLLKFKVIKPNVREIYIKRSNAPMNDEFVLGFVEFLIDNLSDLLSYKADLIVPARDEIATVQRDLVFLQTYLKDIIHQHLEHEEFRNIVARIRDVAYEVEFVIDSFVVKDLSAWRLIWRLSDFIEDIKLIKAKAAVTCDLKNYDINVLKGAMNSSWASVQASTPSMEEVVVGFEDEATAIIARLTGVTSQLDVVSIIGMPGLGKTTLAKKVYADPLIVYHFHIRAWCTVSQVYNKKELFLAILSSIIELTGRIHKMSDHELAEELYKNLIRKRYLIVVDDVWSISALDDLKRCFPDDRTGSKILLTSRLEEVALQAKRASDPHFIRFLTEEESWKLLLEKVFQKESCPNELLKVGKQIAKNCQGLPLAIVVVAGLLAKTDKTEVWWKQVAERLHSSIVGESEWCMNALELSYKHLPPRMKLCFMYCGTFPEDRDIPVWKLKLLWIAEGFVQRTAQKSLEEVAEDYLKDLIGRSLILVSTRKSNGGVKACRIHDLLRDFCSQKAREERFYQLIYGPARCMLPRICIQSQPNSFFNSEPSSSHVRSLLCFAASERSISRICDVLCFSRGFKLLRVLDLINIGLDDLCGIEGLVHLRYLAIRGYFHEIPPEIASLWNLETLIVKGSRGEVTLTDTILSLVKLRHLFVNNRAAFSSSWLTLVNLDKSFLFDNLQVISTPCLSSEEEAILRRLPNLQKLNCIFLESWNAYRNCNQFPELDFLSHLESLKIFYYGKVRYPCVFKFPSHLKKLALSKFCLPWNEMSIIGTLPCLEVLKLLFKSFVGQQWETNEGEFLRLKFLKLDSLDVMQWISSRDHFPSLQRLVLHRCKQLEEIPSSLGEIPTLQAIEVNWCSRHASISAMQIKECQQDLGNEDFKSLIYPPVCDLSPSS